MTGYKSKRAAAQDKMVRMTHIEALKLAQQVMESLPGFRADIDNALDAIKEALAQPAQEPVAVVVADYALHWVGSGPIAPLIKKHQIKVGDNLYTAPPQRTWVDLPHEDILDLFDEHNVYGSKWLEFARAVLAKSKEKNA